MPGTPQLNKFRSPESSQLRKKGHLCIFFKTYNNFQKNIKSQDLYPYLSFHICNVKSPTLMPIVSSLFWIRFFKRKSYKVQFLGQSPCLHNGSNHLEYNNLNFCDAFPFCTFVILISFKQIQKEYTSIPTKGNLVLHPVEAFSIRHACNVGSFPFFFFFPHFLLVCCKANMPQPHWEQGKTQTQLPLFSVLGVA